MSFWGCGWGSQQEERPRGLAAWAPALRGATKLDLVCTDKTHGRKARDAVEAPRDPRGPSGYMRQMRGRSKRPLISSPFESLSSLPHLRTTLGLLCVCVFVCACSQRPARPRLAGPGLHGRCAASRPEKPGKMLGFTEASLH